MSKKQVCFRLDEDTLKKFKLWLIENEYKSINEYLNKHIKEVIGTSLDEQISQILHRKMDREEYAWEVLGILIKDEKFCRSLIRYLVKNASPGTRYSLLFYVSPDGRDRGYILREEPEWGVPAFIYEGGYYVCVVRIDVSYEDCTLQCLIAYALEMLSILEQYIPCRVTEKIMPTNVKKALQTLEDVGEDILSQTARTWLEDKDDPQVKACIRAFKELGIYEYWEDFLEYVERCKDQYDDENDFDLCIDEYKFIETEFDMWNALADNYSLDKLYVGYFVMESLKETFAMRCPIEKTISEILVETLR